MSRRLRTLAAALAVATLALAGCSSSKDSASSDTTTPVITFDFTGTAATADGIDVPAQSLAEQLDVFKAVPDAVNAALGDVPDLLQPGSDQPQPVVVADLLQTEIMVRLIQQELAKRGITPTAEQQQIASNNLKAAFGTNLDKMPPAFVDTLRNRYAEYVALDVALNPDPPEDELQAAYAATPEKWERACARHILVTSDADAQSVLQQLQAGADFAEVAKARSLDTGTAPNGGDLGCLARGETGGAFEEALWNGPVGEIQGPVTSEVGIHILQVTSRGVPPYEEARDDILLDKRAEPFAELGAWVTVRAIKAPITVDPRFGTWDATVGKVNPVGGTAPGLSLTPETPDSTVVPTTTR